LNGNRIFRDDNDTHLAAAEKIGIKPLASREGIKNASRELVPIGGAMRFSESYVVDKLVHSSPFLVPEAAKLLQDIGEVHYEESQYAQVRYMANVAGAGFDPTVTKLYEHYKAKGCRGKHLYAQGSVKSFFSYKSTGVKVWIDGELVHKNLLFSAAIGIGKYNGGGTQQLPLAVADDGLFDITLYRPMHWWQILFRLRRLFNGDIYSIGHVKHYRGSHIRIESTPDIMVEVDGELLGGTPLEFKIHPRCVRVIVNKDYLEN
jgi:diacylglycerol kinase family enzyme